MNLALQSASDLPQKGKQMVPSIARHIEKGVADILSLNHTNAVVAIWELHRAVEKAFKIYRHQHRNTVKTHDLALLSERAQKFGLTVTEAALKSSRLGRHPAITAMLTTTSTSSMPLRYTTRLCRFASTH